MARLYADEPVRERGNDIPRPLVLRLRAMTHDVVTVAELGRCGRSDEQVLAWRSSRGSCGVCCGERLDPRSIPVTPLPIHLLPRPVSVDQPPARSLVTCSPWRGSR